jgi:ubiquinone biosynthesis protein UbiJ
VVAPPPALFQPIERLLNRGIAASVDARNRCRGLEGRSFRMELEGLGLGFTLTSGGESVAISAGTEADARLAGRPLSLARLAVTGDEELLRSRSVRITGDPIVARDFHELIRLAAPDFEEELARLVGDVAARRLANLARGAAGWGIDAADRLSRDVAEYLQEESRDLPTRHEVEAFLDRVDSLAEAADRVEARIGRIERGR